MSIGSSSRLSAVGPKLDIHRGCAGDCNGSKGLSITYQRITDETNGRFLPLGALAGIAGAGTERKVWETESCPSSL
jgi:hypothetical protein